GPGARAVANDPARGPDSDPAPLARRAPAALDGQRGDVARRAREAADPPPRPRGRRVERGEAVGEALPAVLAEGFLGRPQPKQLALARSRSQSRPLARSEE